MNYYSEVIGKEFRSSHGMYLNLCDGHQTCGNAEAQLEYTATNLSISNPIEIVSSILQCAVSKVEQRTLLFWNVVNRYHGNKICTPVIEKLPATKFIAEYKNKRSGNTINVYVTNLQEEWSEDIPDIFDPILKVKRGKKDDVSPRKRNVPLEAKAD